jgi:hypothetical protein
MPVKLDFSIDNLVGLENHLEYVKQLSSMQKDKKFQKFIQGKCLEVVKQITESRLTGGTTNDEWIEEYKSNHKIREYSDGFVLYNDTKIPAILSTQNTKNQNKDLGLVRNYDDGFSIALAFEYGVGIVGGENAVQGAWEYNVNNYGDLGWYYKTIEGLYERTRGYRGFEIYRYTANEIENKLPVWVKEFVAKRKEV